MAAKSLMVLGTMSSAGKSFVTAGLCRIFRQDGYRTAPFKSQNMALNSYITADGMEMGRAQVMQAEAAGIAPDVRMNPILLKPTSDSGSQVIVNGEIYGTMRAQEYYTKKQELIPYILKAYHALAAENDIIVLEGAGSPAEINLKSVDIVNLGMAELSDSPAILVGDIDRGGVFASLSVSIGNFILICQMRAHSATRRLTRGYVPRILKSKKHHPRHKFRFMPRKLLDLSEFFGIVLDLLFRQRSKIAFPVASANKKRAADNVITISAVRLHSVNFSLIVDNCQTSILKTNAVNKSSDFCLTVLKFIGYLFHEGSFSLFNLQNLYFLHIFFLAPPYSVSSAPSDASLFLICWRLVFFTTGGTSPLLSMYSRTAWGTYFSYIFPSVSFISVSKFASFFPIYCFTAFNFSSSYLIVTTACFILYLRFLTAVPFLRILPRRLLL